MGDCLCVRDIDRCAHRERRSGDGRDKGRSRCRSNRRERRRQFRRTSPHAGLAIGGSAAIAIGPTVRIQPELLFTEPRFGSSDFPLPLTVESRAFEVPVLLVKQFSTTRRTRPIVYAGPRFGFITSIAQTVGHTRSDISNEFRSVDVRVALGGGVEVAAGRGAVTIEGRANIGIRDVSKATDNTTRTQSIVGLFGVRF